MQVRGPWMWLKELGCTNGMEHTTAWVMMAILNTGTQRGRAWQRRARENEREAVSHETTLLIRISVIFTSVHMHAGDLIHSLTNGFTLFHWSTGGGNVPQNQVRNGHKLKLYFSHSFFSHFLSMNCSIEHSNEDTNNNYSIFTDFLTAWLINQWPISIKTL